VSNEISKLRFDNKEKLLSLFCLIIVESEPVTDERVRTLIDEELKSFGIKQGDSMKNIEDLNADFIKNHLNSLTHRAEGKYLSFIRIN
jgi:hypothetical protein